MIFQVLCAAGYLAVGLLFVFCLSRYATYTDPILPLVHFLLWPVLVAGLILIGALTVVGKALLHIVQPHQHE